MFTLFRKKTPPAPPTHEELVALILEKGGDEFDSFVRELLSGIARNYGYTYADRLELNGGLRKLLRRHGKRAFADALLSACYKVDTERSKLYEANFGFSPREKISVDDTDIEIGCWSE